MAIWFRLAYALVAMPLLVGPAKGMGVSLDHELAKCTKLLSNPQEASIITFVNSAASKVSIGWVQPNTGKIINYRDLEPGETYAQQTYVGHLWAFRTENAETTSYCAIGASGLHEIR